MYSKLKLKTFTPVFLFFLRISTFLSTAKFEFIQLHVMSPLRKNKLQFKLLFSHETRLIQL